VTGPGTTARPILVTGLPRSGTSWVGKMLQAGRDVVYVNEPLNPQHPPGRSPGVLNAEVSHRFQYICADNEDAWAPAFTDTLRLRYRPLAELRRNHRPYDLARLAKYGTAFSAGRLLRRRALIDDPFAVLSAGWFAQRLGCQVIVCVRHPVTFIGSRQRLGWKVDLHALLNQPLLLRDLLGPYAGELRALADSADSIAQAALLWRVTYTAIGQIAARWPQLVLVRRYEDLASDPVPAFHGLYDRFGLTWSAGARQRIVAATTGRGRTAESHVWSLRGGLARTAFRAMDSRAALTSYRDRLSPEEITRVQKLTDDVAAQYYPDPDAIGLPPAARPG
jgi:Sulfotransferase family